MSYLLLTALPDFVSLSLITEKSTVDGVKGMFESNGQLQLIIGTGTVNKVYDEFLSITGASAASKEEVKAAAAAKQPLYIRLLKPIGDVFVPILPAIVASGLMMGLVEALAKIPGLGFGDTDWFAFLDMVANTAFAYLPVIVAISAARVFGRLWCMVPVRPHQDHGHLHTGPDQPAGLSGSRNPRHAGSTVHVQTGDMAA